MTEARRITDAETLRALAHPLRARLLRLLFMLGHATVGMLAAKVGADPGQVSYHLRKLADSGFIEAAPEKVRDFRQSWWKPVAESHSWASHDFESPAGRLVADTLKAQWVTEQFEAVKQYERTSRDFPRPWQEAATASQSLLFLSAAETSEMVAELQEVCERWARRSEANRAAADGGATSGATAGRRPVDGAATKGAAAHSETADHRPADSGTADRRPADGAATKGAAAGSGTADHRPADGAATEGDDRSGDHDTEREHVRFFYHAFPERP